MTFPALAANVEPDERVVEEVHCSECGLPISTIPNWYANVHVKFTCDLCRQKSPRLAASAATADAEVVRASGEGDGEIEPALDEIEVDDIEIEDSDAEE
jgi:hypothetical protein